MLLMLVLYQHVSAHGLTLLQVSAAVEIRRIIRTAPAVVESRLRIRTDRPGTSRCRRSRTTGREDRIRSNSLFNPLHQRTKCVDRYRSRTANSAMADTGGVEQPIEALQPLEVR